MSAAANICCRECYKKQFGKQPDMSKSVGLDRCDCKAKNRPVHCYRAEK